MKKYIDVEELIDAVREDIQKNSGMLSEYLCFSIEGIQIHVYPDEKAKLLNGKEINRVFNNCGFYTVPINDYVVEIEGDE